MTDPDFKPVTPKAVGLTPEEIKYLVEGAQKYLAPEDEDGDPIKETIDDKGN